MTVAERPTVHVLDALRALRDKRRGVAGGAFRSTGALENLDRNTTDSRASDDDPFGGPKLITDPAAYGASVLDRTMRELADTGTGGRNAAAHKAGQVVGRHVGAGLVADAGGALNDVIDACRRNGLVDDDGLKTVQDSVASGYQWGLEHPVAWEQAPTSTTAEPVGVQVAAAAADGDTPAHSSWLPTPILEGADAVDDEPEPELLTRGDGKALIYVAKVNALIGESESGKTWVALFAIRQALASGGVVAMLDFEDTRRGVRARLRQLGAHDSEMARFFYASPDEALDAVASTTLAEFLADRRPALVVVDGVNAAMTQLGLDLENNKDVTRFTRLLLKPLTRLGAAVVTIDHVTKSKDSRGNYAIGAQAKRADVDGVALIVEVVSPFGRGQTGRLKLTVSKDRPGYVRGLAAGAKHVGDVVIASNEAGHIAMSLDPPAAAVSKEDEVKTAILDYLRRADAHGETVPKDKRAFATKVAKRYEDVNRVVDFLEHMGTIERGLSGSWCLADPFA